MNEDKTLMPIGEFRKITKPAELLKYTTIAEEHRTKPYEEFKEMMGIDSSYATIVKHFQSCSLIMEKINGKRVWREMTPEEIEEQEQQAEFTDSTNSEVTILTINAKVSDPVKKTLTFSKYCSDLLSDLAERCGMTQSSLAEAFILHEIELATNGTLDVRMDFPSKVSEAVSFAKSQQNK